MSKRFGETFEDLYSMKEQMDKLFRSSLERIESEGGGKNGGQWFPPADMYDDGLDYVLEVEVPGVKREDLEVSLLPDTVRLKGKRHFFGNVEQEKIVRLERPSGIFDRRFQFPGKVDADHVQAVLSHGILTLRVPKKGGKQKKVVSIKRNGD